MDHSERRAIPKDHLDPTDDGEALAEKPVRHDDSPSECRPFEDVEFQKDAERELKHEVPPDVSGKVGVGGHVEASAVMVVAEVVAGEREGDGDELPRDVEPGSGDTENHAYGEEEPPACDLDPARGCESLSRSECGAREKDPSHARDMPLDDRVERFLVGEVVLVRSDVLGIVMSVRCDQSGGDETEQEQPADADAGRRRMRRR